MAGRGGGAGGEGWSGGAPRVTGCHMEPDEEETKGA